MERRNLLKMIGLLGIAGVAGVFSSCSENMQEKTENPDDSKTSVDKKAGFNRNRYSIKDPENPTKAELKHTPEISVKESDGDFTRVEIIVGSQGIIHPTSEKHWIDYIKLFADDKPVGMVEFEAGMARGFASFIVKNKELKTLKAEIGCNLHGIWESSIEV